MCTGAELALVTSAVVGTASSVYSLTQKPKQPQRLQEAKPPVASAFRNRQATSAAGFGGGAAGGSTLLTAGGTPSSLGKATLLGQ